MASNHTSTPWIAEGAFIYAGEEEILVCIQSTHNGKEVANAEANAAFIVKAVNAHDELVAALRRALPAAEARVSWRQPTPEAFDMAGKIPDGPRDKVIRLYKEAQADVDFIRAILAKVAS